MLRDIILIRYFNCQFEFQKTIPKDSRVCPLLFLVKVRERQKLGTEYCSH